MKKILIILLSVFLASCGVNMDNSKNTEESIKNSVEKNEVSTKKEEVWNTFSDEKKVSFEEVKNNLEKLKDLDNKRLEDLDFIINDFYSRDILEKAKKSGDLNKCDKLDKDENENCKKQVIIVLNDEKLCKNLINTNLVNSCKNTIFRNKAEKTLDEKICDNIIDNSEDKFEINSCKSRVLFDKAVKNLDYNICNKIKQKEEKQMCIDMVKTEKENKKILEKMKKIEKETK